MIDLEATGLEKVIVMIRELPARQRTAIAAAVWRATGDLAIYVKQQKLSGQVLNQRTQRLVRSIHPEVTETTTSIVGTVGTNVEYAAYQEYGFSGTEQVREHERTITVAFGKTLPTPVTAQIRAHSRNVNYPAHSYLRSSLAENEEQIRAQLAAASAEASQQ
jgi:phage gpG-like protein